MDNNFAIKQRAGVQKSYSARDPIPVRESAESKLDPSKGIGGSTEDRRQRDQHGDTDHTSDHGHDPNPRNHHTPHEVIADPESRNVINRENDVRATANTRDHPDQALLRQRAYRPASGETEAPQSPESHANIEA
jgi:hypothetical protein